MASNKNRILSWMWIAYPVLVVVFIAFTGNALLSNQERFTELMQRQERIKEDSVKLSQLQQKLNSLEKVDLNQGKKDLELLVSAVPASKNIWALVTELKMAATDSGITIDSYKGSAGDIKEATPSSSKAASSNDQSLEMKITYTVKSFEDVVKVLSSLDKRTPLLKINKLKYLRSPQEVEMGSGLELVVEGAWKPWEKVSVSNEVVPAYVSDLAKLKTTLDTYTKIENISADGLGDTGVTNPF